jgi:hypothetical protein
VAFRRRLSWVRPVATLLGLVAFIGGVIALFTIDNSAGSLFLLTLGFVLLLVAFLGKRIQLESFEFLGARIRVREVVRSRLQLAQLPGAGDEDGQAADMRKQALTLQKLVGLYRLYEYIRRTETASSRRTQALDQLASRMQATAGRVEFDPAEVSTWFHEGSDALRVVALNLMLAREECRDFLAVLETVNEPRSLFEQFYGLQLGLAMLPNLDHLERRLLADAIGRAQSKRRFRRDRPLMNLSNVILAKLQK